MDGYRLQIRCHMLIIKFLCYYYDNLFMTILEKKLKWDIKLINYFFI